jgi:hypothetical protein
MYTRVSSEYMIYITVQYLYCTGILLPPAALLLEQKIFKTPNLLLGKLFVVVVVDGCDDLMKLVN